MKAVQVLNRGAMSSLSLGLAADHRVGEVT